MRKNTLIFLWAAAILIALSSLAVAASDTHKDRKVYYSEKWDILLLYPKDWSYVEQYRENVPVVMYPPKEKEPDGFIMVYFLGEKVFDNMEDFSKHFEDKYLGSYATHNVIAKLEGKTKEGYVSLDYRYTFVDGENAKCVSDCRLTIAKDKGCWMISHDYPQDGNEGIEKEAIEIIGSIIFSAADYLTKEK